MPQPQPILYSEYVDAMRIVAEKAQPFTRELKHAAPSNIQSGEKKALKVVVELADEIDAVLKDRARLSSAKVRPVVVAFVNAWGGMSDALLAATRVPAGVSDRAARAADAHARIFPEGSLWLRGDAQMIWSHGNRLLQRIDEEGLARELDQVVGADYHAAAAQLTAELGDAIGVGRVRREALSPTGLQETILVFSRAVGAYCRQLAANVDDSSAASIERFRKAVAPIDAYRSSRGPREDGSDAPVEPDAPAAPEPTEPADPAPAA